MEPEGRLRYLGHPKAFRSVLLVAGLIYLLTLDRQNPEAAKFLEWYTSPEVVSVVSQILDVPIEKLQLGINFMANAWDC